MGKLEKREKVISSIAKAKLPMFSRDLYKPKIYDMSYKTFVRILKELNESNHIKLEKVGLGRAKGIVWKIVSHVL